jgi:hypothetical protein
LCATVFLCVLCVVDLGLSWRREGRDEPDVPVRINGWETDTVTIQLTVINSHGHDTTDSNQQLRSRYN